MSTITGIVMAGGKSSRMGTNKALLPFQGKRLIDRSVETLLPLVNKIIISSNEPLPELPYPQIADSVEAIGPLGGLQACLNFSSTEWNMLIPCDTPFLSDSLYQQMLQHTTAVDAVIVTHSKGKIEPLIGLYNRCLVPLIEEQIARGDYKLINLLRRARVFYFETYEVSQFRNMNHPGDLL
ncbi:MAG: molybdenum cofactor guanylyltransferase [Salinivirgaceae bacterium]